jgi:hypothetical protein
MNAPHDQHPGATSNTATDPHDGAREPESLTRLRGAQGASVGGRVWSVVGVVALAALAVVIAISFGSAHNDNARIERMKDHGLTVNVTVTSCVGNLGGSGSNGASYTCAGTYAVRGVTYRETIDSLSTFVATGTTVRAVADPSRPSSVELAAAVATSRASNDRYVVPSLLALAWVALVVAAWRLRQRRDARRDG